MLVGLESQLIINLHFTWKSKKQPVVARSAVEIEYWALALGFCEGMSIQKLLDELRIETQSSFKTFCDSQTTASIAKNCIDHNRTKYIEINRHFIYGKVNKNTHWT